jgi:hypothetical protein
MYVNSIHKWVFAEWEREKGSAGGLHALGGRIPFAGEGKGRVAEQWLQTRLMLDVCEPGGVEEIVTNCRDGEEIKLRACGMLICVSAGG